MKTSGGGGAERDGGPADRPSADPATSDRRQDALRRFLAQVRREAREVDLAAAASQLLEGQLLRELFDASLDPLLLIDEQGRCTPNAAAAALFPCATTEGPCDPADHALRITEGLETLGRSEERLLTLRCGGGTLLPVRAQPVTGTVSGVRLLRLRDRAGAVHDEHADARDLRDPLTGLATRALFHERVVHALALAARDGRGVAVALLDVDDFKKVNGVLGHAAGDLVLVEVARRLMAALRGSDTAARFGGDEFAVLLEGLGADDEATEIVDRLLDAVRMPYRVDARKVILTASVGLVVAEPASTGQTLLRDADTAVTMAKESGRNRLAVFHPGMHRAAARSLQLRAELATALAEEVLEVHYQPIVDLDTGAVQGAEALLRWPHPSFGAVPPVDFVPIAERNGLIIPLGGWVLERACSRLADWQRRWPGFRVSVNIAERQLVEAGFVERVAELIADYGILPGALCLELTESAVLDAEQVAPLLQRLRALGVSVAVDDFGTGYSSFAYLQRFALDTLKIDREFVSGVGEGPEQAAIVRAILQLAGTLGLGVIAEGVETAEQAALLRSWACSTGQGWHWAPALRAEDLEVWIDERRSGGGL
jgi:diguanylate cyclase (GGDEF)-like protein